MRIGIIIILLFECFFGMAQNSEEKPLIIESNNDSIDISANFYNIYDSLTHYSHPSDVLYNNWNTKKIHYKDKNGLIKTDSILIVLQDSIHEKYFVQPIIGPITSHFGYRRYRFHYGTDLDLVTGDPVKAAMDGMVRITTYDRGFGRVIVIRHSNGLETVYAHLSKIKVDTNQIVKAGEIIALGGNTGRSTGSHLHFEVRYLGKAINPETIVDFKNAKPIKNRFYLTDNNFRYLNRIAANKNAKFHYVRSGDTLSAISRKYHTTISKLCYYNGINQNAILHIGQKLRIK